MSKKSPFSVLSFRNSKHSTQFVNFQGSGPVSIYFAAPPVEISVVNCGNEDKKEVYT